MMDRAAENIRLAKERDLTTVHDKYIMLWHGTSPANYRKIMKYHGFKSGTWFAQTEVEARKYGAMSISRGKPVLMYSAVNASIILPSGTYWTLQQDAIEEITGYYDPRKRIKTFENFTG